MIKKIILGFLSLIIVVATIGFFLPHQITVTKDINITAPIAYVFEEVNELERWADWSYGQKHDRSMEITYGEIKSGRMASFSWKSDNGDGSLRFAEYLPDTVITTEIYLTATDTATIKYKLTPRKDTINLAMRFDRRNFNNPLDRWIAMVMIKPEVKKAIDYELQKIKDLAEAKPIFTIKITEESLAPTYFICVSGKIDSSKPSESFSEKKKMFQKLRAVFKEANQKPIDFPFCFYPGNDEVVYAMTTSPDSKFSPVYTVSQHYSGAAIKGIHVGAYEKLSGTHEQIKQYVDYKRFQMNGAPWEVYVTDPDKESDPNKWITEVYYPVK